MTVRRGTGYIPDPPEVAAKAAGFGLLRASQRKGTPREWSLRQFAPPIWDQYVTGSCVGHALVAAAMTSLSAAGRPVSPSWCPLSVYALGRCLDRKPHADHPPLSDTGAWPDQGLCALAEWGVATVPAWMGIDDTDPSYSTVLAETVNDEPRLDQLQACARVLLVGPYRITSTGADRVADIRRAIAAGHPVCCGVVSGCDEWQGYHGGVLGAPPAGTQTDHYVYLDGYRTDEAGRIVVMGCNSWGREWGADGCFEGGPEFVASLTDLYAMAVREV